MKIQIRFDQNVTKTHLLNLKKAIEKTKIAELDKIDVERATSEPGTMSIGGLMDTLVALITAAKNPLTELVKCLQIYIKKYRTDIQISVGDITIKLKADDIKNSEEIVRSMLEAVNTLKKNEQ